MKLKKLDSKENSIEEAKNILDKKKKKRGSKEYKFLR